MCCECLKKKSDKCLRIVKNRIYSLPMNLHNQSVVFVFSKSMCVICVQVNIYNCDLKTDSVSQPINIFVDKKHITKIFHVNIVNKKWSRNKSKFICVRKEIVGIFCLLLINETQLLSNKLDVYTVLHTICILVLQLD